MLFADVFRVVKVGNGTGDFENPVVGAGGKAEAVSDHLQQAVTGGIRFAELT